MFDTLLTRKVASPSSLFLIVGNRAVCAGLFKLTAGAFREHRVRAEEEARVSAPGKEVNLEDIYRLLIAKLALSQKDGDLLSRLELAVEAEMLTPVPGALELVSGARCKSPGIFFVSDMYLPTAFINDQLKRHGFWRDGDQLFVSSEWKASKADGSLFRKLLDSKHLRPDAIHHTGDRKDADFEVPSRLGIKARHLEVCGLTRYEQMLEDLSSESGGFSSLVAGTSRLTRLQRPAATSHLSTLAELTSSLISPIITFYALWLLREAGKRGLKRLYFVARDGYLVKKLADALIRVFRLPMETRYLYGSRQAWHLPAITDFSDEALSWLFEKTRTLNLRIVLARLHLAPESIEGILTELGWFPPIWDRPLDDESLGRLKTDLLGSAGFRAHVEKIVVEKREAVLQYLDQERLFDGTPWAIVDLGWHGRLQQSLEKLLGMRRPTPTVGLYFALYADSPALARLRSSAYLDWDLRCPPASKDIPSLVFLMESFCTAPHGSTVGYRRGHDGRIVPDCRQHSFEPLETWGISTVHSTVEEFARKLEELTLPCEILTWDSKPALLRILLAFSRDPLAAEARAWGTFPYEDEQAGTVHERLTAGYSLNWETLRIALIFGDERFLPGSWKVLWHGGQKHMLTGQNSLLKLALRAGSLKRRLASRLRRYWQQGFAVLRSDR